MQSSETNSMNASNAPMPQNYPEIFVDLVNTSIAVTAESIDPDAPSLSQAQRKRAMHVLGYALKLTQAWPTIKPFMVSIAPKMEQAGHRDDWLIYLEQGLICSQQEGDHAGIAEFQWQIGHLYRLQSQFDAAEELLRTSAATFGKLKNNYGLVRVWNELGQIAWRRQLNIEAEQFAEAALAHVQTDDAERAVSLAVLGGVALRRREWQRGEEYLNEALRIHTLHNDQQRIAWTNQHLGYIHQAKGNYTAAIVYYENAILTLTAIQDLQNCGISHMSLGVLFLLMQQPRRALTEFVKAEALFRTTHYTLGIAKVLTNEALAHLALDEWSEAIVVFRGSATLYQSLNDLYGCLNAMDGLGEAYVRQGNIEEARTVFQSALAQTAQLADSPATKTLIEELSKHLQELDANN